MFSACGKNYSIASDRCLSAILGGMSAENSVHHRPDRNPTAVAMSIGIPLILSSCCKARTQTLRNPISPDAETPKNLKVSCRGLDLADVPCYSDPCWKFIPVLYLKISRLGKSPYVYT